MGRQIKCENCDEYYSASRSKCPHCGAKRPVSVKRSSFSANNNGKMLFGGAVLLVLIIAVIIVVYRSLNSEPEGGNPRGAVSPSPVTTNDVTSMTAPPDGLNSPEPTIPVDDIPAEAIVLSHPELYLPVGATFEMSATLSPITPTSLVLWTSSDPNVAIVNPNDGKVTAIGAGSAQIIAAAGTAQATCTLTVGEPGQMPSGVGGGDSQGGSGGNNVLTGKLNRTDITLSKSGNQKYGKTWTLKLDGHTDGEYYSNNTAVATVSSGGVVTAVGKGHTTITVTYEGATYKCDVHVID